MTNANAPINSIPDLNEHPSSWYGLTKREYFAAMALQASDLEAYADKYGHKWAYEAAKDSVKMADVLIIALNQPENDTNIH